MFIRNAWYVAAWAHEVGSEPLPRTLLGEPVVLFRGESGKVGALEDRCAHRGLPLRFGTVTGDTLTCGYHGVVFDCSGKCASVPGQDRIPAAMAVRSFPIVEKDELIWIWMGEAQDADESKIVDYPFHGGATPWPHLTHTQHVKCDWKLMIGNLMDLTHLAYVHKGTIGGDPDAHTQAKFDIFPDENGVRFIRWLLNSMPPKLYVDAVGFQERVDRWMEFEFIAPSTVKQFTGALNTGEGAYEEGNREGGFALRVFHHVTPETEDSCLYFWSGANGYRMDEPQVTGQLFQGLKTTFAEDEAILEAQHASLKRRPSPVVATVHDKAVVHADRVIRQLMAQQSEADLRTATAAQAAV